MKSSAELAPKLISGTSLKVSVVVPCYNAFNSLDSCLASLFAQSTPAHEIIVVDDGSDDHSLDIARKYPVKIIARSARGGAAQARAQGAAAATGDIVAFLDSDCSAPNSWIETIARHIGEDSGLGGVGGGYRHEPVKSALARLSALEEEYAHHLFALRPEEAIPPGGNSAFRKNIWDLARSQKELLFFGGMGSGEDSVVGHEIKKLSRVKFTPELSVYHQGRGGHGYFRRHLNRGISRSTILFNRLSDNQESGMALQAYGGWRLLASNLFFLLGFMAFAFAVGLHLLWLGLAGVVSLVAYFGLAHQFFNFIQKQEAHLPTEYRLSLMSRIPLRLALVGRSGIWAYGAGIGLWRGVKFRLAQSGNVIASVLHFWRPGKISKLFFFVTSQCNARCEFCFNLDNVIGWKERKVKELSLDEITKIAKNFKRMPYLTLSGGEPFLREDLPQLIEAFYKHAKTQWVTIPTNAALTDKTLNSVLEILRRCPGLFFTVQVSLDSLYEDHDKSRKIAGGFEKMARTLKALSRLRSRYRNLRIQIATCYDTFNKERMDEIVAYCRQNFGYDQQMFYLIRETRTLITESNNGMLGEFIERVKTNDDYESRHHGKGLWHATVRLLQSMVYQDLSAIKVQKEFLRPCHAVQKFATLYDDGNMTPCEILEYSSLGNIRDFNYNYYELYRSRKLAAYHQKEIVDKKCNCDWMCAVPINMLYDPKTIPRFIKRMLS